MSGTPHPDPRFPVDPGRLYEVGPDGLPRTDRQEAMAWLGPRHRRLVLRMAVAAGLVGAFAALAAGSVMLGAKRWAAAFALATLAATPLLLVGPGLDWWRHRRGRRRAHRSRPEDFPAG